MVPGKPAVGRGGMLNATRLAKYSDFGPVEGYTTTTNRNLGSRIWAFDWYQTRWPKWPWMVQ